MDGWEHSVALGSVGFSRGVHYWEFTIDTYTADTDPAFGIARIDVARDKMLGKLFFLNTNLQKFSYYAGDSVSSFCFFFGFGISIHAIFSTVWRYVGLLYLKNIIPLLPSSPLLLENTHIITFRKTVACVFVVIRCNK